MTMRERGGGETDETFVFDVGQEVYLKGRDDPIQFNSTFLIRKELIDLDVPVESVMSVAMQHLMATIDVVREHRYIISDSNHNKLVFLTDELQAISLLAPSKETVIEAMNND